jgi:hypothetical protein
VNYNYVKLLAKKRSQIIKEALEATLSYFPDELKGHPFHSEIAQTIETFFLLDHCVEAEDSQEFTGSKIVDAFKTPKKYANVVSEEVATQDQKKPKISFKNENPVLDTVGSAVGSVGSFIKHKVNPLDTVGSAVGSVGTFLKHKLSGDEEEKDLKDRSGPLPPIDTSLSASCESLRSPVVPYTRKTRRSMATRVHDEDELNKVGEEANLLLDDDRPPTELVPSYSHPIPNFRSRGSKIGDLLENNPLIFALIAAASVAFLKFVCKLTVTMDLDILLLLIWASFCIGLHTPRPMIRGIDRSTGPPPPTPVNRRELLKKLHDFSGRRLLRMSLSTPNNQSTPGSMTFDSIREEEEQDQFLEVNQSPMPMFPEGAELGSQLNCWSEPAPEDFQVRGSNYLADKVKVASGAFVFPVRGVDLFLTDTCPENAGRYVNSCMSCAWSYRKICNIIYFRTQQCRCYGRTIAR